MPRWSMTFSAVGVFFTRKVTKKQPKKQLKSKQKLNIGLFDEKVREKFGLY